MHRVGFTIASLSRILSSLRANNGLTRKDQRVSPWGSKEQVRNRGELSSFNSARVISTLLSCASRKHVNRAISQFQNPDKNPESSIMGGGRAIFSSNIQLECSFAFGIAPDDWRSQYSVNAADVNKTCKMDQSCNRNPAKMLEFRYPEHLSDSSE